MTNVFISWSGNRSLAVARALTRGLPTVIQELDAWMSDEDIEAGARWSEQISGALGSTETCIVCVTRRNQYNPWLNFEAGAVAKTVDRGRVYPYLVDLGPDTIRGPLAQFQAVMANEEGTLRLVNGLNKRIARPLGQDVLHDAFAVWWRRLKKELASLPDDAGGIIEPYEKWPRVKSASILLSYLSNMSATQRRLLALIASADDRIPGSVDPSDSTALNPYAPDLAGRLDLSRSEVVYRCLDLERSELVQIESLTDYYYAPSDGMVEAILEEPKRNWLRLIEGVQAGSP